MALVAPAAFAVLVALAVLATTAAPAALATLGAYNFTPFWLPSWSQLAPAVAQWVAKGGPGGSLRDGWGGHQNPPIPVSRPRNSLILV